MTIQFSINYLPPWFHEYNKGLLKQMKHQLQNPDFIKKETGPRVISQNSPAIYSHFRLAENGNRGGFKGISGTCPNDDQGLSQ